MSAYSEYFDRLNAVTNANYDVDDLTVDLSASGVTPEYFAKIDGRSDALLEFFNDTIAKPEVRETFKGIVPLDGNYSEKDNEDLMLCLLMDLVQCFEDLNHSTSLSSCEGLALLNVLAKVYRPDYYMSYGDLSEVPSFIINLDGMVSYIEGCIESTDIIKQQSIISSVLQVVNTEADKQYRILMYRLCEAISEADGIISDAERSFLMTVLRLDDDDVTNDIETDSIFNRN